MLININRKIQKISYQQTRAWYTYFSFLWNNRLKYWGVNWDVTVPLPNSFQIFIDWELRWSNKWEEVRLKYYKENAVSKRALSQKYRDNLKLKKRLWDVNNVK